MHEFEARYFEREASYARKGGYGSMLPEVQRFYEQYFRIAASAAPEITDGDGKRALEVGCAFGAGMRMLRAWRYDVYGTDISAHAIAEARRRWGEEHHFKVADAQLPNPFGLRFGLIVAIHVVEHLSDIRTAISTFANGLDAGGYLIIATPNPSSISPYRRYQRDPTHVNEQRPSTWVSLLAQVGLHVISCKTFHVLPVVHRWLGLRYIAAPAWLGYDTVVVAQKPS